MAPQQRPELVQGGAVDRMTVAPGEAARQKSGGAASGALLWVGLAFLAVAGLWQLVTGWREGLQGGHDFVQDYAAVIKIGDGRNPYSPYNDVTQEIFGGPPHKGNLYSFHAPTSLPLLIWLLPFAKVGGYTAAFLAWGAVSFLSFWALCWLTLRAIGVRLALLAGLLAALSLVTLPAVRECFEEGQLNVVVAAGMVGCWAARREGRSGLAGVLLALGFALKPIPGLFFIYYAWRRDLRLLVAAAIALALLTLAGVGMSGLEGVRLWATVNYPSHASYWPGYPDNSSLQGYFTRIFGPSSSDWRPRPRFPLPYASLILWAVSGGLLTLAALAVARGGFGVRAPRPWEPPQSPLAQQFSRLLPPSLPLDSPRGDLEIAVLTVLSLLVTPIVWPHYYVVLVMPVAVVVAYLGRLVLDGTVWYRPDPRKLPPPLTATGEALDESADLRPVATPAPFEPRRRIVPLVSLIALGLATALLASAHYVEPYRGVGGQLLVALLIVFGASLVALGWSVRDYGDGRRPEPAR